MYQHEEFQHELSNIYGLRFVNRRRINLDYKNLKFRGLDMNSIQWGQPDWCAIIAGHFPIEKVSWNRLIWGLIANTRYIWLKWETEMILQGVFSVACNNRGRSSSSLYSRGKRKKFPAHYGDKKRANVGADRDKFWLISLLPPCARFFSHIIHNRPSSQSDDSRLRRRLLNRRSPSLRHKVVTESVLVTPLNQSH